MIKQNPFTSKTFTTMWCNHFNKGRPTYAFDCIEGATFYKPYGCPLYINTGKNMTKGMSYSLKPSASQQDFKNKVALIYDVPKYFSINTNPLPKNINSFRIRQYPGLLTNLESYADFNSYFSAAFSKKSQYKFKRYQKNLEKSFDISYKHWYGTISKQEYDLVFEQFHLLLKKRFDAKLETNNNLDPQEWNFYRDSSFELILEKKASLFVVYDGTRPIALSLNYLTENILFFAMTVFDIDYFKYNIGKVHLMELYKWCFTNNIKIFDLSKGYYDYKERWSTLSYDFEYHIYYDATSLIAITIATLLNVFFKTKQYLREKKLNDLLHKSTHYFKRKTSVIKKQY